MSADNTIFNDMIIDEYGDSDLREFFKTQQVIYGRKSSSLNLESFGDSKAHFLSSLNFSHLAWPFSLTGLDKFKLCPFQNLHFSS